MPEVDEQELGVRLDRLQERLGKFNISSSGLVSVVGTLRTGLAVNIETGPTMVGPSGGPPTVGACCFSNGSCAIQTADECSSLGGTYQGDNTTCSPNPCSHPTGACCLGHSCSIHTALDCANLGGTYQGDNTTCSPNPCPPPPCGFQAFDGSNHYYLHKHVHCDRTNPDGSIAQNYDCDQFYSADCSSFSDGCSMEIPCDCLNPFLWPPGQPPVITQTTYIQNHSGGSGMCNYTATLSMEI